MSVAFAWRWKPTRCFGSQWVPFADLHLRSTNGRWHTFAVQVDTGAVVSVLPRSAAELLAIRWREGELADLSGISGPARPYFVHILKARLGDLAPFSLRVAFADSEDVPNLLGRLDFLDRSVTTFDGTVRQLMIDLL